MDKEEVCAQVIQGVGEGGILLFITSLRLQNYRNYERLAFVPSAGVSLLLGDNAQGKTNVLESIYVASTGRSHRTRKDQDLVMWGKTQAQMKIVAQHTHADRTVEMQLFAGNQRRRTVVNGAPIVRAGELLGQINSVLFAPEDLSLIKDGPGERRRFMDIELSQAKNSYFYELQKYMRILKQRNVLLRNIARQPAQKPMLSVWDEQLALVSPLLYRERVAFVEQLSKIAKDCHRDISSGGEELSIVYHPSMDPGEGDYAEKLLEGLKASREDDIRRGTTSLGLHRDDLQLRIQGRDARMFASQGQQRTVALSLKLSELQLLHKQTGECPILLLDDVMSELDAHRRDALLAHMSGVQTILSAAMDDLLLPKAAEIYRVQAGILLKA